jgi:hypothetical protein
VSTAVLWTTLVTAGLLVWVLVGSGDGLNPAAAVILLMPAIAAGLCYARPRDVAALVIAGVLLSVTAVLLFIGRSGLLYVPSLALLIAGAARELRQRRRRISRSS